MRKLLKMIIWRAVYQKVMMNYGGRRLERNHLIFEGQTTINNITLCLWMKLLAVRCPPSDRIRLRNQTNFRLQHLICNFYMIKTQTHWKEVSRSTHFYNIKGTLAWQHPTHEQKGEWKQKTAYNILRCANIRSHFIGFPISFIHENDSIQWMEKGRKRRKKNTEREIEKRRNAFCATIWMGTAQTHAPFTH